MTIDHWCDPGDEPKCTYGGCVECLLQCLWDLCITFPYRVIAIIDNDVCNAFRMVELNLGAIGMHGFQACDCACVCTGQSFGANFCLPNFDIVAQSWQCQFACLWINKPEEVSRHTRHYLGTMKSPPEAPSSEAASFASANADAINSGVLDQEGNHIPPVAPVMVDDLFAVDVLDIACLSVAASIASLEDACSPDHPCQEKALSQEKLDLDHGEIRLIIGHTLNIRLMRVCLSDRKRSKILKMLVMEGWLLPHKRSTVKDIATLHGIFFYTTCHFPWARIQLIALQHLLGDTIRRNIMKPRLLSNVIVFLSPKT